MKLSKPPPSDSKFPPTPLRPQSFYVKTLLAWSVKIGLSMVALWLVFAQVDVNAAFEAIKTQDPYWLLLGSGLILAQITVGTLRWQRILRGLNVICSPLRVAIVYYISIFVNTCLPGGVGGDVIRAWMTSRATSRASLVVNSIFLDRLATLAGLAIIVIMTEPQLAERLNNSFPTWILSLGSLTG